MQRILIVEDKEGLRRMLRQTLEAAGYPATEVADGAEAIRLLEENRYDLVITDLKLPKRDGLQVLAAARGADPDAQVIVMTAFGTVATAVQAMKEGAFDYIEKDADFADRLVVLVERALERRRLSTENRALKETVAGMPAIVGTSRPMKEALALVEKVAPSAATVLLLGESGTGKELFARSIHTLSPRRDRPLVAINCAAIPDTLLENELFGHERGAFTGASGLKQGKFELADGGTLFLDEIGDLSAAVQAKLLRVLQEHTFERVGGTRAIEVDVRIIAATNVELGRAVREKRFREDLYFRLNVFPIAIPPLRDRPEDLPVLVQHFISKFALEMRKRVTGITSEALRVLQTYAWPGNVREVENAVERAVILATGEQIQPADLALGLGRAAREEPEPLPLTGSLHEVSLRASQRAERELIRKVLRECGGNKTRAAEALQVSYKTLLTKIKDYGLQESEDEAPPLR
ncbi:MAG TPA: sigma-54 dependent transcriptional regulator [Candidatus Methylomirabilis sp.]|jgi:DNA-binding NtrC family response regulator